MVVVLADQLQDWDVLTLTDDLTRARSFICYILRLKFGLHTILPRSVLVLGYPDEIVTETRLRIAETQYGMQNTSQHNYYVKLLFSLVSTWWQDTDAFLQGGRMSPLLQRARSKVHLDTQSGTYDPVNTACISMAVPMLEVEEHIEPPASQQQRLAILDRLPKSYTCQVTPSSFVASHIVPSSPAIRTLSSYGFGARESCCRASRNAAGDTGVRPCQRGRHRSWLCHAALVRQLAKVVTTRDTSTTVTLCAVVGALAPQVQGTTGV